MTQELRDSIISSAKAIIVTTEKIKETERLFKEDNASLLKRIQDLKKHCEVLQDRYDKAQDTLQKTLAEPLAHLAELKNQHISLKRKVNNTILRTLTITNPNEVIEAYKMAHGYGEDQTVIIIPPETDMTLFPMPRHSYMLPTIKIYQVVVNQPSGLHWVGAIALKNNQIIGCQYIKRRPTGGNIEGQMWVLDPDNRMPTPKQEPRRTFRDMVLSAT